MEIEKALNGTELTLKIIGRLDTVTAPELEACLKESLDGIANLVMDFAALDYISSAGLRVILQAQKTMNKQGDMLINEVFEMTGFVDILNIE